MALESPIVTQKLPQWIDLIFGMKSRPPHSLAVNNAFHPYFYPECIKNKNLSQVEYSMIQEYSSCFGCAPIQIFNSTVPSRPASIKLPLVSSLIAHTDRKYSLQLKKNSEVIFLKLQEKSILYAITIDQVEANNSNNTNNNSKLASNSNVNSNLIPHANINSSFNFHSSYSNSSNFINSISLDPKSKVQSNNPRESLNPMSSRSFSLIKAKPNPRTRKRTEKRASFQASSFNNINTSEMNLSNSSNSYMKTQNICIKESIAQISLHSINILKDPNERAIKTWKIAIPLYGDILQNTGLKIIILSKGFVILFPWDTGLYCFEMKKGHPSLTRSLTLPKQAQNIKH